MEATPRLHCTASSEYLLDVRCCRALRSMASGKASTQLVQYSYFDCDVVVLAVSKPDLPEAAESSTYLIIGKDLLVAAGCMASETESRAFSSLKDHPEYDVRDRSIPVGTADFLRGPVHVCCAFHPFTAGHIAGHKKVAMGDLRWVHQFKMLHAMGVGALVSTTSCTASRLQIIVRRCWLHLLMSAAQHAVPSLLSHRQGPAFCLFSAELCTTLGS